VHVSTSTILAPYLHQSSEEVKIMQFFGAIRDLNCIEFYANLVSKYKSICKEFSEQYWHQSIKSIVFNAQLAPF
jgi:hypothetical protein